MQFHGFVDAGGCESSSMVQHHLAEGIKTATLHCIVISHHGITFPKPSPFRIVATFLMLNPHSSKKIGKDRWTAIFALVGFEQELPPQAMEKNLPITSLSWLMG